MRRALSTAAIPLLLAALAGCRNPFDPSADVIIDHFNPRMQSLNQAEWSTQIPLPGTSWDMNVQYIQIFMRNFSTVGVSFTSYTVVYRQVAAQQTVIPPLPANSPIAAVGGAEGLTFKIVTHLPGMRSSNDVNYQERSWEIQIVTDNLLQYINNTETKSGGIDCEITMHGTDHNGHDVTATGVFHIEVF